MNPTQSTLANQLEAEESLADLVEEYSVGTSLPEVDWLTRLNLEKPRHNLHCLSARARWTKRVVDVIGASGLLVVLAPVMLAVAVTVKVTSPGPVIFSQERVGLNLRRSRRDRRKNRSVRDLPLEVDSDRRGERRERRRHEAFGKPFVLYKFRTMRTDAEKNGAQLAVKNDPRVTRVGRFLRKTRLDELPQLWNVLKGEMSLVGPRPERPEFMDRLSTEIPNYVRRLGLQPGLTGVAQIVNGYDTDIESVRRKVALDLLYLQNCTLKNDFKILLRTIRVVMTGSGAV